MLSWLVGGKRGRLQILTGSRFKEDAWRNINIEFAYYHVMARGNRRKRIYRDEDDRRFFNNLGETCEMTGWRVPAWGGVSPGLRAWRGALASPACLRASSLLWKPGSGINVLTTRS